MMFTTLVAALAALTAALPAGAAAAKFGDRVQFVDHSAMAHSGSAMAHSGSEASVGTNAASYAYSDYRAMGFHVGALRENGWRPTAVTATGPRGDCHAELGHRFRQPSYSGDDNSLELLVDPTDGIVNAVARDVRDGEGGVYQLVVQLRAGLADGGGCKPVRQSKPPAKGEYLFDRAVVMGVPGMGLKTVHLPLEEPTDGSWQRGACFDQMGIHYFKWIQSGVDTTSTPSYRADELFPVVPMYGNGRLVSFFFQASTKQTHFLTSTQWDKVYLPGFLMCKNWCDSACSTTSGSSMGSSTGHIFVQDMSDIYCHKQIGFEKASCMLSGVSCCPPEKEGEEEEEGPDHTKKINTIHDKPAIDMVAALFEVHL